MDLRWRGRRRETTFAPGWIFLAGAIAGALAASFLDPQRGRTRRARMRDRSGALARDARERIERRLRDARNRAVGRKHELEHADERVEDGVLVERVRAQLGRVVKHAGAIRVEARDGAVALSGPVLRAEMEPLLDAVRKVRGVTGIENRLDAHESAGSTPGLQG
jgi:osmotically-inducible protein OsmY